MKKLLLILLLSLGLIGSSYADDVEDLVKALEKLERADVTQINDPPSDSWKCKKGYIKRGNRCINEEEFQEAFEANIRLFVDGPDGYIIQGGVCKGVGCPN